MKKSPYQHQRDAVVAIMNSWRNGKIPVADCVTGFGKSLVAAILAEKALKQNRRVLILVPSKELCEQNYAELIGYTDYPQKVGMCCVALNKYQTNYQAVVATWTAFLSKRLSSGAFDMVIIDECDLLSYNPKSTLQRIIASLRKINPNFLLCGLTGTPYRMHGSIIEDNKTGTATFNEICYESDIVQLMHDGYLSRVELINSTVHVDLTGVTLSQGDYSPAKAGVKFAEILPDAIEDMRQKFDEHNIDTALIFASSIENAEAILLLWGDNSTMRLVHGKSTDHDRREAIKWLKHGSGKRYIVNVGIYTTGFDYKQLECVVLLRATKSKRLYKQIVGRVIRAHADKEVGYLIDYGTNVERLGSIDGTIPPKTVKKSGDAPKKACLECGAENRVAARYCRECQAEFVINDDGSGLYTMRTKAQIMEAKEKYPVYQVSRIAVDSYYSAAGNVSLRIIYFDEFDIPIISEYLAIENTGKAGDIARSRLSDFFVDKIEFYKLLNSSKINCADMAELFFYEDERLKEIESIAVGKQKDNPKYKEIKSKTFRKRQ